MKIKEIVLILVAAVILGFAIAFPENNAIISSIIYIVIILSATIAVKKLTAYYFESDVETKLWGWYQFGFRKGSHFKKPLPMLWLPLLLSLITRGYFLWLAVLESEITPRVERLSRRHGLYRFTEMTDWHISVILSSGVIMSLLLSIIGYIAGFGDFAKLSVYFAIWSLVPLSSLDGTKIFFGSRVLWLSLAIASIIFFSFSAFVV